MAIKANRLLPTCQKRVYKEILKDLGPPSEVVRRMSNTTFVNSLLRDLSLGELASENTNHTAYSLCPITPQPPWAPLCSLPPESTDRRMAHFGGSRVISCPPAKRTPATAVCSSTYWPIHSTALSREELHLFLPSLVVLHPNFLKQTN